MLSEGIILETMSAGFTNFINYESLEIAAVQTSLSVSERNPIYYEISLD